MASGLNKVHLIGNLGNDPDCKYTQAGKCITRISLATTNVYKDKEGNRKEDVQWHRVVFFGKIAEIAGEYLRKGSSVYIEGSLKYDKFTGQDGVEKYTTDIVASELKMLGGKQEGQSGGTSSRRGGQEQRERPQRATDNAPQNEFADDDIPFVRMQGGW